MPTSWSKVVKSNQASDSSIAAYDLREVSDTPIARRVVSRTAPGPADLGPLEQTAYDRGFAAGEQAGREAGLKEIADARRALGTLITELTALRARVPADYEDDLVTLAFSVAERILGEALPRHPQATMAYVREAVALLGRADRIVIKVHPGDLERLTREVQTLERTSGQESILRFEADSRLRPGECLAETANRSIDARISAQLTALEQQVRRADRAA